MFKSIIILSKELTRNNLNDWDNFDIEIFETGELIDNNSLNIKGKTYYFDYLIIDDLSNINNLNIEKEHRKAITNYDLQTSIENIFAIGNANNSSRDINEELQCILSFISDEY